MMKRTPQEAFRDERLDVLAGTRGDANKHAVRKGEIPSLVSEAFATAQEKQSKDNAILLNPAYQKFPSGLIVQAGEATQNVSLIAPITFQRPFPNACVSIVGIHEGTVARMVILKSGTLTKTGAELQIFNTAGTQADGWTCRWLAIGY
jgi:hypothetical protein